ncbi:bcl-2/adenovirus E1B 19 kDa-interacting protein 2-like protein [Xenopus tropicalis]|uniref:Bcl-2/adenovirus E1B 19 kDa-interacting protein 2-like protein n=2 Tax=Xenopus tropicalis TaxID=8364 RepID=A0A8J0PI49_XENTR|nr:bcl-2/adenovirus E1B 19 kDa-interacting protein 2-like protein [Xenopus tropicalis]|eukprot:NP_001016591.1 bcl-2/adenovirus E1B 19 kDa-interacting protein 2-like protein [Xenopus tropicalis]
MEWPLSPISAEYKVAQVPGAVTFLCYQYSGSSKCYGPQASAPTGIDDMELKEEWQDEDFPRPLPEAVTEEELESSEYSQSASTPNTIELCGNRHLKKRLSAPSINFNLENSGESIASSEQAEQSTEDLDFDIDDLETPNSSELLDCPEFEWDDDLPKAKGMESSACSESRVTDMEDQDGRKWRIFLMGEHKVDMTAIEPYKQVISHGGYYGEGLNAVIVFASCYLPQDSIPDYQYVLNNLFRYIIGTLDLMVADDYMLVYLNGATPRCKIPPISWIKRCYQATGRRLKKNLKSVLILHPTWYVKALLAITRPFISSKFWKKVKFMSSIEDLSLEVSLEQIHIPDCIRELDKELNS